MPKGPSDDPADKRFAVETEDHPLDYADFEGEIPPGNYGAGHVIVWDRGRYLAKEDLVQGFERGKLLFQLDGYKLQGTWTLVRLKTKGTNGKEWLLIKEHDQHISDSGPSFSHESVLSGLTVEQLKKSRFKNAQAKRVLNKMAKAAEEKQCEQVTTAVPMRAAAGLGTGLGVWPGGDMTTSFAAFCLLAPPAFSSFGFFIRDFFSPDSCVLKHDMSWRHTQTTHPNSSVKSSTVCALNTVLAH